MTNLQLAKDALVYARDGLSYYKSNNKSYSDPEHQAKKHGLSGYDAENFRIQKAMIFQAFDKTRPKPGAVMDMLVDYGRAALKQKAGNCQEYTSVVCSYLDNLNPRPVFDAVFLEPPADHTFVVIGQQADGNGEFPMSFAYWNADAAICDPWANIACLAFNYPDQWDNKLHHWADDKGKRLPGASRGMTEYGVPIPGGWSTPREPQWLKALVSQKKLSFTYSAPEKTAKCCFITTAVCTQLGLPDDCHMLNTLRKFRDDVLLNSAEGRRDVAEYYAIAPKIVSGINQLHDAAQIYNHLYTQWLYPAIDAIKQQEFATAYCIYKQMVDYCCENYMESK